MKHLAIAHRRPAALETHARSLVRLGAALGVAVSVALGGAALALTGCAAPSAHETQAAEPRVYPAAQEIVERAVARHPQLVRLTLHAVPRGETKSRIVASSVRAKLGAWSDPEDLDAMRFLQPVRIELGENLDFTAPVIDGAHAIAALGVLVSGPDAATRLASARAIADEVGAQVVAAQPLW